MPQPPRDYLRPPGMEWCYEHGRWEALNDRVDFAVSDDWLDLYHRQGLTPRQSGNYNHPSKETPQPMILDLSGLPPALLGDAVAKQLLKRLEGVAAEFAELRLHMTALERRPKPSPSAPSVKEAPKTRKPTI